MQWRVAVDDEETTAIFEPGAAPDAQAVFVCAHGAGGHREDRGMVRLAAVLRPRGFDLVRFNFLYRENGSSRPDMMQNALATVRAPWEMHWLEGADHSFHVLKSSGRTDADVLDEVGDASQRWLARR